MTTEIIQRIDALAEKLGTASEHLWAVMVRQQYIEPLYHVVPFLIFGCVAILMLRHALRQTKDWDQMTDNQAGLYVACWVIGVFSLLIGLCAIYQMSREVIDILNPEHAAFEDLMKQIRSSR